MAIITKTLKLPFLALNRTKAAEFERLTRANTKLANTLLELNVSKRRKLTTADIRNQELSSICMVQTIRNSCSRMKVKKFKRLPIEFNNQGWDLHKIGETYSVSFSLTPGRSKRVPIAIHQSSHAAILEDLFWRRIKKGTLKLWCSHKGIWYVCISVSMEVPDAISTEKWIGVDRGQNIPAVAALPNNGRVFFFKSKRIAHIRREYSKRRKLLQKAGKFRAVKKLGSKERRIVTHINHCLSKQLVNLAVRHNCGLRFEDLKGIRNTKQYKKVKADSGKNRDFWPFYQLEIFSKYKSAFSSVAVENIPAPFTSKTHNICGHIGVRKGFDFYCQNCDKHEHADANAARNIGQWTGMFCVFDPSKALDVMSNVDLSHGVYGRPLNSVSNFSRKIKKVRRRI